VPKIIKKTLVCLKCLQVDEMIGKEALRNAFAMEKQRNA
jgi:hypothetical protein